MLLDIWHFLPHSHHVIYLRFFVVLFFIDYYCPPNVMFIIMIWHFINVGKLSVAALQLKWYILCV